MNTPGFDKKSEPNPVEMDMGGIESKFFSELVWEEFDIVGDLKTSSPHSLFNYQ